MKNWTPLLVGFFTGCLTWFTDDLNMKGLILLSGFINYVAGGLYEGNIKGKNI